VSESPITPADIGSSNKKPSKKEVEKRAIEKAIELAEMGQTFDYILGVWQKRHTGDAPLGKSLLFSLGSQSVSNSKGIHVLVTGEGGYGKSDGIKQMGKLVDPSFWKNGGVTPQTLYYSGPDMPDGVVVGLEDVVWKSELGASVKRITSEFQEGAMRLSTVEMRGTEVWTAKRIGFWASCADNEADEQLRDRFLMYCVKADPNRRKAIIGHMQAQDEGEQLPEEYEFETMVCQALTYDLKQKLFQVTIPFATRIKFEGDPRAYGILADMIKSSALFRYRKRETDEAGRLIATEEDYQNAKELYIELGGHDRDKYSEPEIKVLYAILANCGETTQAKIQELSGLSAGRVSDILNGRGKEGHGLLYKCKEIVVVEGRPKKYKLSPGFNPRAVVSIELAEPT
jgi:hypothetical protein